MENINQELDPLFNPRSVAVIGATKNWNKWGYSTFLSVLQGFKGNVYPINRNEKKVLGYVAYKKIGDVPEDVDLAIFVIPAENIPEVMEECAEKGVKAAVIISAGFRETGAEGRELEDRVVEAARKGGIRFVGPNCMGMWSASSDLRAYMFPLPTNPGPIAFVSQGGNVGAAVVMAAINRGTGFHRYVSCGATADIQIEDYIEYFAEDPNVKVILTYIEGLNDGTRFIEKVSKATIKKPVIALKPGKTEACAHAILSHSGAIAGVDDLYDEAFKKAGVIRADSPEELLDIAVCFLTQPLPPGRNVAIITGGGSYGVLCAEYCESNDLNVIDLPEETISAFNEIFPPRWSHGNPVDPAGDRNFIAYYMAPEMVLKLNEIDALIFMGFGSISGITNVIAGDDSMFFRPLPPSLTSLEGVDDVVHRIIEAIDSGDIEKTESLINPIVPIVASLLGSDPDTMSKFISMILSRDITRSMLKKIVSDVPDLLMRGASAMIGVLEEFDKLVSSLLFTLMKVYGKPIISTTFTETAPSLHGAAHAFPTAEKAAVVLSKLVEYREYLERVDAFEDPRKYCFILNNQLDYLI